MTTLPLALLLAVVTPLGGVADETAHAARAESLSAGQLFEHRGRSPWFDGSLKNSAGVDVDVAFLSAHEVYAANTRVAAADVRKAQELGWTGARTYVEVAPLAPYFPVFYGPAAITIAAAKVLGASPYNAFLASRLTNVAVFAALGLVALLIARRGQGLFFCVLSLPMTVSLAASLSQDGLIIASSVCAASVLTRTLDDEQATHLGAPRLAAAAVIGLIGLGKIPYLALAALLLLPLPASRPALLRRVGLAMATVMPATLWVAYAMSHISVPWPPMAPYSPGPLWPGAADLVFNSPDAASQLRVLLAAPTRVATITWYTISTDQWIVPTAIGVLGFLSIPLPSALYSLWQAALASACVGAVFTDAVQRRVQFPWRDALVVSIAVCLGVIAIYMSQYLTWTIVGAERVEGPTGRYLLPLLPALVFATPVVRGPAFRWIANLLLVPACVAALFSLVEVPRTIIDALYLR
jgi:hypothetical protein